MVSTAPLPTEYDEWSPSAREAYQAMYERALVAERNIESIREQFANGLDSSKQYISDDSLSWQAAMLQSLNSVLQEAATTLDLQQILDTVTQLTTHILQATSAYVCDWDTENKNTTVLSEYMSTEANQLEKLSDLNETYALNDEFEQRLLKAPHYWVAHRDSPNLNPMVSIQMGKYGAQSILHVPMIADGTLIGYIEVWESRHKHEFSARHIEFVTAIANQISGAVHNIRLHRALQESESRYRLLMNTMREGLVQVDAQGAIQYANESFGHLLDYSAEDLIGSKLDDIWSLKAQASSISNEWQIIRNSGELIWIQRSQVPIINAQKQYLGTVYAYTDVTKRHQADQHAVDLVMERERLDLIANFVQNISHEFYTPLSIIGTNAYLMQKQISDDAPKHYMKTIRKQAALIHDLVKALVTMTTLESTGSLKLQVTNLYDILTRSIEGHKSELATKNIQFSLELDNNVAIIRADGEKLLTAFNSIFDNAIRYTPENGQITISLSTDNKFYLLKIQDNGLGMSADVQNRIFERFYREDSARTTSGFGLGLPIAKRIIELHKGQITINSEANQGTTVCIKLPKRR